MRLAMGIVGGVIVGALAMGAPAHAEDARAITVQGRSVILPPLTAEYSRLLATLPTAPKASVVPSRMVAVAAVSTPRVNVAPPAGPPDGTPLMQRLDYFKSAEYRQWFENLVKATAREHLSGASRPR